MKNIIFSLLIFLSLNGIANTESAPNSHVNHQENINSSSNQCGYTLGENIASKTINSSENRNERFVSFNFYLLVTPTKRPIQGKLSFSCSVAGSNASSPSVAQKRTAADVIASEDSGGRYGRNIAWQRKYKGNGWNGTIAYVNSVFGDQVKLASPDYFLICPNKIDFPCFSFEIIKEKLNRKESDRIPEVLDGIGVIDSRSMTPATSDKQR